MTPLPSLAMTHASADQQLSLSDRPERSRNAKAQARHRAKRKAYIEQLEQTVTKLQSVLALSPDQVASLPPPLVRIRELEQENNLLQREIEELRHELESRNSHIRPDITRRSNFSAMPAVEERRSDRDIRRRRLGDEPEDAYLSQHDTHLPSPPPPLLIPPLSNSYTHNGSNSYFHHQRSSTSSLSQPYGLSYQMPGTPSSSTSSPSTNSFSPADHYAASTHPHHRSPSASSNHTILPPFSHTTGQYDVVKVEDDSYSQHHHHMPHPHSYSTTLPPFSNNQQSISHWNTYASERG